ncbi:MAG: single-stranded DNA-binding protein [Clostridia bacterium]|nr:single-stranded DNA-binding protein [Clostridia bacterium]
MNNVVMIGRLTKDPELRFTTGSNKAVSNFTIAVDRSFSKNKETDFFRVVAWGNLGESCANYLAKGRLVAVQGSLRNTNYETKEGEKKYLTEILAGRIEFLERKNKEQNKGSDFQPVYDDNYPF